MTIISDTTTDDAANDDVATSLLASFHLLPPGEQRLATVLAVAVSATPDDLARAYEQVWNETPDPDTLAAFCRCPLLDDVQGRLRLVSPLDVVVASGFRQEDEARFAEAHRSFAEIEHAHAEELASAGDLQQWVVESRVAYYVLRLSPDDAADKFIDRFDRSPASQRRECRLWLSNLVERYSVISGEPSRIGKFFSAFRFYLVRDYSRAEPLFEDLLSESRDDKVAAVSFHLLAVCLDRRTYSLRRKDLLTASIALSTKLALRENLLMARNSAVYDELDRARRGDEGAGSRAVALAESNNHLADALTEPVFQTATLRARALARWVILAHAPQTSVADDVLDDLRGAKEAALKCHDLGSWILASVSLAGCLREVGDLPGAAAELEDAVLQLEVATAVPADLPRRQFMSELDRVAATLDADEEFSERLVALERRFRRAARQRA